MARWRREHAEPHTRQTLTTIAYAVPTLGTRPDWLRTCLRSLTSQAVQGVVIEVVGPSASPAEQQAAEAAVEYVGYDEPGLSAAVNHVWQRHPEATYFGWLGDDDGLAPGSLRLSSGFLDGHPRHSAAYGRCRLIWQDGTTYAVTTPGRIAGGWLPYGSDRVPQQGTLFRAAAVRQVGYLDTSLRYAMDYDLLLKLRKQGPLGYLPYELGFFRLHDSAISYNKQDTGQEHALVRNRAHGPAQTRTRRLWSSPAAAVDSLIGKVTRHLGSVPPVPHDASGLPYTS